MQFVLRRRHEEIKERYQPPCVAREQSVPQPLFHLLHVFHSSNQLIIVVQQIIPGSIQLLHHRSMDDCPVRNVISEEHETGIDQGDGDRTRRHL